MAPAHPRYRKQDLRCKLVARRLGRQSRMAPREDIVLLKDKRGPAAFQVSSSKGYYEGLQEIMSCKSQGGATYSLMLR